MRGRLSDGVIGAPVIGNLHLGRDVKPIVGPKSYFLFFSLFGFTKKNKK